MHLSNWQAALPDSTMLSMINLPGTHDSCTQFVSLSLFSRCQNKSILQQLELGARLLDVRLELCDESFVAVHGIANCRSSKNRHSPLLTFDMIFNSVKIFIEHHTTETVVLSLKMDRGNNIDDFFPTFYKNFIEPYPSIWFLENRIPALNECRGKLVLMRCCDLGKSDTVFTSLNTGLNMTILSDEETAKDSLPLPYTVEGLDNTQDNFSIVVQDSFMYNPSAKWKKAIKPMLENIVPENKTIAINFLSTAGVPFIPYINSKYVNSKFYRFDLNSKNPYGWLVLDFITEELAEKIIHSNFR